MYFVRPPWWLKKLYSPYLTWSIPTTGKEVFLTFDDGPHPTITPFVLECLEQYNAKATFFCIGKNVKQYNEVYQRVIAGGHKVGNHTNNHLNGWKTEPELYIENIRKAGEEITSRLFRPPYGRIRRSQVTQLIPEFKIIMWDVLSGDFDTGLSPEKCLRNVVTNVSPGSVIVFHDSEKAFPRLQYTLPRALQFLASEGYIMKTIV